MGTVTKKAPLRRGLATNKSGVAQMVFYFGQTRADGDGSMRELLGGKGARLAEMTAFGLPVPPGFTITTETCQKYEQAGRRLPHGLMNEVHRNMATVQKETGRVFGDPSNPLLVSVRSGAAVSMPGMLDTVLNLGLSDEAVDGLAEQTGNRRFALDAYRRLISMFGHVVMGTDHAHFERAFDEVKAGYRAAVDTEVPEEGMERLVAAYQDVYRRRVGDEFPQNPFKQLELAIEAVFNSWNSERAVTYRRLNGIAGLPGTAVNIQAMVFGNIGDDSGTGVAFTRNPSTGENKLYGEFLVNAQGEDVLSGIRTPRPVGEVAAWNKKVYQQLLDIKATLERHYADIQDVEFTVERGRLYILQARSGKRTGHAAVRAACDMVKEKLISEDEALRRIPAGDLIQLLLPSFDPAARGRADVVCVGLPASPGAAVGKPAFSPAEAVARAAAGERVILVRPDTSPADIEGMHAAAAILTSTGGMTSHAAVVARGWGKTCVVGAGDLTIDEHAGTIRVGKRRIGRDDVLSVDGSSGEVMLGPVATVEAEPTGDFAKVMRWADKHRTLGLRVIAANPADAVRGRDLGAQGVGMFRTEAMFQEPDRLLALRQAVFSEHPEARAAALERSMPSHRDDFIAMFDAMKGMPVAIRLLDTPLYDFLPRDERAIKELAGRLNVSTEHARARAESLRPAWPLLGVRGCRLAMVFPEVYRMQMRAVAQATIECLRRKIRVMPEVIIPMVCGGRELAAVRDLCTEAIHEIRREEDFPGRLDIKFGAMIETPRAAIAAAEIAPHADFLCFGGGNLTQLALGMSREDVNVYLPAYLEREVITTDPFQSIDEHGVGEIIRLATERARAANPAVRIGLSGQHAGDTASVRLCHRLGLDYVSCAPFHVPIARLAAAQAVLAES